MRSIVIFFGSRLFCLSGHDTVSLLTASSLSLGLQSGVLLAVPIPDEYAAAGQQIEDAIQAAVTEAR